MEGIERVAYELCEDEKKEGVVYFEARFSPHFLTNTHQSAVMNHTTYRGRGEVNPKMVVDSFLKGLKRGEAAFGVKARVILCCISGHSHWSEDVLDLALANRDNGVVGIDIAGCAHSGALEKYEAINQKVFEVNASSPTLTNVVHAAC